MRLAFAKTQCSNATGKLINFFTGRKGYYHVEIVFGDDLCFSSSLADGGTRFKKIQFDDCWDVVSIPVFYSDECKIRAFCEAQVGKKYDLFGALGVVLHTGDDRQKWFCSEVIIAAIQKAGFLAGVVPSRYSPNKLYELTKMPEIWHK